MDTILKSGNMLLDLSHPKIMGILNFTPDSFYDGGKYHSLDLVLKRVETMISEGMDVLDIGAASSRPGAKLLSLDEEWSRLNTILAPIRDAFPDLMICIDSFSSEVVHRALDIGVNMINDISAGLLDAKMMDVVRRYDVPYIMMQMDGDPSNMQSKIPQTDIVMHVLNYFKKQLKIAYDHGISDVIIDPGFGFAKSLEQNYLLLKKLHVLKIFQVPILVGLSRKSMIYKLLDIPPQEALNGTSVLHFKALEQGVKILRVHDVREAKQTIELFLKIKNA